MLNLLQTLTVHGKDCEEWGKKMAAAGKQGYSSPPYCSQHTLWPIYTQPQKDQTEV